jgi:glucan-binding YG repeat protein
MGAIADNDGYVYYFNCTYTVGSRCAAVKNRTYYVTKDNGLIPNGYYTMDEQGRIIDGRGNYVKADTAMEDGLKFFADDSVVYYENGAKKAYADLIEFEGAYYYINDNAKPIAGKTYYITRTNGLTFSNGTPIPKGTYSFDNEGRMILKNGLVDGVYYENNAPKANIGVICQDGKYYYIAANGKPVTGRRYFVTKTNGLVLKGWYHFDANGVMIQPVV